MTNAKPRCLGSFEWGSEHFRRTGGWGVPESEVGFVAAGGSCTSTMSPDGRAGTVVGLGEHRLRTERREGLVEDAFVHVVAQAANEDGLFAFCALFHGGSRLTGHVCPKHYSSWPFLPHIM